MDAATIKFEHAIAFAILPVSSELAALHTSRTRSHLHRRSCFRCGTDLTTAATRLARSKRSSATRPSHVLSTNCCACGEISSTPVDIGKAGSYPPCRKSSRALAKQVAQKRAPSPSSVVLPNLPPTPLVKPPTSNPTSNIQFHKASKKRSGLQKMLQKNRENEQKRTQTEATKSAGLSAFLSTL